MVVTGQATACKGAPCTRGHILSRAPALSPKSRGTVCKQRGAEGTSRPAKPQEHSRVPHPSTTQGEDRPAVSTSSVHMQSRQRGPATQPSLGALTSFSLVLGVGTGL